MSITLADSEEIFIDSGFRSDYPESSRGHSRSSSIAQPETAFGTLVHPTVARPRIVRVRVVAPNQQSPPPIPIPPRTPIKYRLRSNHSRSSSFGVVPTPLNLSIELPPSDEPLLTGSTVKPPTSSNPFRNPESTFVMPARAPPLTPNTSSGVNKPSGSTPKKREGKERDPAPPIPADEEVKLLREALKEKEDTIVQYQRELEAAEQQKVLAEAKEIEAQRAREATDAAYRRAQEEARDESGTISVEEQYEQWMNRYRNEPSLDASLMSRISRLPLHLSPYHVRERLVRTEGKPVVIYELLVEVYQTIQDIERQLQHLLDRIYRIFRPKRTRYIIDNAELYITPLQSTFSSQERIRTAYAVARGRIIKGTEYLDKWLFEYKGMQRSRSAFSVETGSGDLSPIMREPEEKRLPLSR